MSPVWPDYVNNKIPEGHYTFRIIGEPELRKVTMKDKQGFDKEVPKLVLKASAVGANGNFTVQDNFLPWEDRYRDLKDALGIEHGANAQVEGAFFEADIKHEPDKKDPMKSWPRIVNIVVQHDVPAGGGDDIPF